MFITLTPVDSNWEAAMKINKILQQQYNAGVRFFDCATNNVLFIFNSPVFNIYLYIQIRGRAVLHF